MTSLPERPPDASLDALYDAGIAVWPELVLSREAFRDWARAIDAASAAERDDGAGDLVLACACACAIPGAADAFERAVARDLDEALAQVLRGREDALSEVRQRVLVKLLVRDGEDPPRIARYRGRGPLRAWVRVTAVREALSSVRRARPERALDDAMLDAVVDGAIDPELAAIRERYRPELARALRDALGALDAGERTLLRMHVIDGRTIDQLAPLFGVHRATIARRVSAVRERLSEQTRTTLEARLGIDRREVESLVRVIGSSIDVSLARLLASGDERG